MSAPESVLFIDYATTVKLLPVPDAMAICEDVFRMHARNSVKWSVPPSQKLDVGAPFHNHWHVKTVILEDEPIAGVRLYSYYDDGLRNTVGRLDCARYIVLADPRTGQPIAILDEHWTYAIRSAAAAMVALKWLGPSTPRTLGLIGVGTMGENCLRCLRHLYRFEEIICTSRRADTREAFAAKWSKLLGIPVRPLDSIEEVVRNADIAVGGTTRTDIVSREPWVQPGSDVRVAGAPRNGSGGLGAVRQGRDRRLGLQHDRARVSRHDRRRSSSIARACMPTSARWWPASSRAAIATTSASSSIPPAWCRTTSASPGASTRRRWRRDWASRCRPPSRSRHSARRIDGGLRTMRC